VGAAKDKIGKDMEHLQKIHIENLMLLRGDPPKGSTEFSAPENGFSFASDLISFVKERFSFSVGAAAYPEKHPESGSLDEDIQRLKIKCEAGADFLITQLFFNNEAYTRFVQKARMAGINCRIIPGIIPITNYKQIKRYIEMTSATFPAELLDKLETHQENPDKIYQIGIDHAISQCLDLLEKGAPGIHFYTLNKSRAAVEVFESLPRMIR
jgi:methylenetetrahydrofolate reductase (NADPH)